MSEKKWNINILLCREVDENTVNIKEIFNKLYLDNKNRASFVIITLLNSILSDEKNFKLYYFLEKVEGNGSKITLLGSTLFTKVLNNNQTNKKNVKSYVGGLSNAITHMSIDDCEFIGPGNYEIKIYKFDNEDEKNFGDLNDASNEEILEYANDEHLVSVYPFEVCLNPN